MTGRGRKMMPMMGSSGGSIPMARALTIKSSCCAATSSAVPSSSGHRRQRNAYDLAVAHLWAAGPRPQRRSSYRQRCRPPHVVQVVADRGGNGTAVMVKPRTQPRRCPCRRAPCRRDRRHRRPRPAATPQPRSISIMRRKSSALSGRVAMPVIAMPGITSITASPGKGIVEHVER